MSDLPSRQLDLIAAVDANMSIGKDGVLPWSLPDEFAYFQAMTTGRRADGRNAVLVGRKTWDTMGELVPKPFPGALNVVLTRRPPEEPFPNTVFCPSLDAAVAMLAADRSVRQIWVLGGARVYRETLLSPHFHRLYLTRIQATYDADCSFPSVFNETDYTRLAYEEINDSRVPKGVQTDATTGVKFEVCVYEKKQ